MIGMMIQVSRHRGALLRSDVYVGTCGLLQVRRLDSGLKVGLQADVLTGSMHARIPALSASQSKYQHISVSVSAHSAVVERSLVHLQWLWLQEE